MKNYTIYKKKMINFYVERTPNQIHHWQKKFPSST